MIQKFQRNATIRERRAWIRLCAYCCGTIFSSFRFRLDETYLLDVILLYTVGSFRSAKIIFAQKLPRSVDTSRPFSFL
ncbi:unnamed protein product [Rhizophagus irregularis]|uniref:Uncharacterized protein n=1 Tax=Rhizophagus irregularis TaxID=588596 RepID=A0A915ZUK6_9GLOM|nr:unnamed protein product [Rhizophagus irregularis]CAB4482926.1 unnamed protein product [Rhizophagus irregularis]CAB5203399.1 unnamed protein product [Rhizophagus irregularis]CAB5356246.1 unnamed protein product [Rhizophagus irregularis]CAB5359789.1 unnamed protein product [Rhizophagus irregularis]